MGLFDTICYSNEIASLCNFKCNKCQKIIDNLQTKDLECSMLTYALAFEGSQSKKIKLYTLDEPDKKYWHEYTDEEISEHNSKTPRKFSFMNKKKGDGYYLNEAFKLENRKHRYMGEHPHKYIRGYNNCCGQFHEFK